MFFFKYKCLLQIYVKLAMLVCLQEGDYRLPSKINLLYKKDDDDDDDGDGDF